MATTTEAQQRAALKLHTIELMVDDLPEVAAEWGELPWGEAATDEQLSWSIDWSNKMAALESVGRYAADGLLSQDQQARYERVVQKARLALPTMDRLNLRRPDIL